MRCIIAGHYRFHFGESTQLKTLMSNRVSGMSSYTRGGSGVKPLERESVKLLIFAMCSDISYVDESTPSNHDKVKGIRHVFADGDNSPNIPCLVKALEDMAQHKRR